MGVAAAPAATIAAGTLIGLLGFKPQLAILAPVALIAGGHWRAVVSAAATGLGLAITTILFFGSGVWSGFFAGLPLSRRILQSGLVPYYDMQSIFAAVRLLGASPTVALSMQSLVAIAVAAIVAWYWRRPTRPLMRNAVLVAAIPLASPFFLDYDLTVVALAMAWLVQAQQEGGPLPWEGAALTVVSLVPLVSRTIGAYTHILLAPFAVAALLAMVVIRIRRCHLADQCPPAVMTASA